MKLKKKILLSIFTILLSTSPFGTKTKAIDKDFDYSICTSKDLANASEEVKQACRLYQEEIGDEATDIQDKIDEIKKQQEENKKNIEKGIAKVSEYEAEEKKIASEIETLEEEIKIHEVNIADLKVEIDEREKHIEKIDKNIKDRMVSLQSFMHINNYIDFLIGASSFMDLIRRVEALADIQSYDNNLMSELDEEVQLLSLDQEKLINEITELEEKKKTVEAEKEYVTCLKEAQEQLLQEYYKKEAELEAQEASLLDDLSEVMEAFKKASKALGEYVPSDGWTKPIPGARVSASTWHYPKSFGGGIHLGVDLAASVGTTVKAAANGYVLFSYDECDTYGHLGSSAGYPGSKGGGNQVYLLVSIDDRTYAVKYLHLKKSSCVEMGEVVSAGEKIAEVGSSGNSSGPHCHVEIFYLGKKSISYYASNWDGDFAFGCGYSSTALNHTCDDNGAPCRLAPQKTLGY